MRQCNKCGFKMDKDYKFCPSCGAKTKEDEEDYWDYGALDEDVIHEQVLKDKMTKKKRILIAVIALVVCVALVGLITYFIMEKAEAKYMDNIELLETTVSNGIEESRVQCNLTTTVWYNAIFDKDDKETLKYTKGTHDFNDALSNLYYDKDIIVKVSDIESNQNSVKTIMGKLNNPPKDCVRYHEVALDLYSDYKTFTNLAVNPTGSYDSYSEETKEAYTDVIKTYSKLTALVPLDTKD